MSGISTQKLTIDESKLLERLTELGNAGRDSDGELSRLAASTADKSGRDLVVEWMKHAGLAVSIDQVGNIIGTWPAGNAEAPLLIGSHIDSVINAGIYDGCYGVIAGLSVIEAFQHAGVVPDRPIAVGVFTNEEGVRYAPDMMGSLVYAGGLTVDEALASVGTDESILGEELERIGYAGQVIPGSIIPFAFLELHIEQGPVLETECIQIGAVENLQGISWQKISIVGVANHAGTTPTRLRNDAGLAAAKVNTFLRQLVSGDNTRSVATVGTMEFFPNAVNVVPSKAVFTVDLRDPDDERLGALESSLAEYLIELEATDGVSIKTDQLVRFEPVTFDSSIVSRIEAAARTHNFSVKRMTSGAGHDAQMMSRICPAAMIFVPSREGISHNPREHTEFADLVAGVTVLSTVVLKTLVNVEPH
jgi:N-carbamoyl-L-amino-acid hydrolase